MKLERLLEMTTLLLNRERITAAELAERFEVSQRTIYRDIDALSMAGIPVYATKGKGGGISLMQEYTLDKSLVNDQERADILIGLQSLRAANYPTDGALIEKLSSIFKSDQNYNWLEVDFSEWGKGDADKKRFADIRDACINRNLLHIEYINTYGQTSERVIEPIKLFYKAHAWYLYAWCRNKVSIRMFRISRILRYEILTETFPARSDEDTAIESAAPEMVMVHVHLHIAPPMAYRVYDEFSFADIHKNADGSADVHTFLPHDEWIYGYLLSYGSQATVLAPQNVRDEFIRRLQKILLNYDI